MMGGLVSFVGDIVTQLSVLTPTYVAHIGEAPTYEYLRTRSTPTSEKNIWVIHEGLGSIIRAGSDFAADLKVRVVCDTPNQNYMESALSLDILVERVLSEMYSNYKLLQGGGVENFNMYRLFSLHYVKEHYFEAS